MRVSSFSCFPVEVSRQPPRQNWAEAIAVMVWISSSDLTNCYRDWSDEKGTQSWTYENYRVAVKRTSLLQSLLTPRRFHKNLLTTVTPSRIPSEVMPASGRPG